MEKNKRVVIIISIILLTMLSIFLVFKKDTSIVEKNEVNKIERKEFSILKEQTYNGKDWKLSNETAFPTSGYLLNETQSKCYDYNGKEIEYKPTQELTKGSIDGRVTIESNKTVYCELYFDLDNKVPEVKEFSITGKTSSGYTLNNGFTYQTDNIPYKLEYDDTDVTQYCISKTDECTEWTEIKEKINTLTIDASDGEKIMYIYLKDKANNISSGKSAAITVDQTKPVVKTFNLIGTADTSQTLSSSTDYTHKAGITYNATITESNIESYCIYEDNCSYTSLTSTTLTNKEYSLKDTEESHSVKIRVKDKAGNESEIETKSIALDKTNPTATISPNTQDTSSITVTVGYQEPDSIIKRQCKLDSESTWTDAKEDGSCTISNLSDGQTYKIEARVRDASGRWNTDYPSVSVTTESANFSGRGQQLIKYNPKGLSSETDCQGMYRFVGTESDVNNYICFGYTDGSQCSGGVKDNDYIYRIIGIESNGSMKLLKNKPLGDKYNWHSSDFGVTSWSQSDLFKAINGSEFLDKLRTMGWNGEIVSHNWPDSDIKWANYMEKSANEFISVENELRSVTSSVGLLSLGDVFYSNSLSDDEPVGEMNLESWVDLHGEFQPSLDSYEEWLVNSYGQYTPGGLSPIKGYSWRLSQGNLSREVMTSKYYVRPVFYVSLDSYIRSGSGSSSDPFILDCRVCIS